MFLEMQAAEHSGGVDVEDGIGGLARIEGEQDGDQPSDDVGVAVADKAQARYAVVWTDSGGEPHLTHAALHFVGGVPLGLGQGRQSPAELDDVAIAILPVLEKIKIGNDLIEVCGRLSFIRRRWSCGLHDLN